MAGHLYIYIGLTQEEAFQILFKFSIGVNEDTQIKIISSNQEMNDRCLIALNKWGLLKILGLSRKCLCYCSIIKKKVPVQLLH